MRKLFALCVLSLVAQVAIVSHCFAQQGGFPYKPTFGGQTIKSTNVIQSFYETDGAANAKNTWLHADANVFNILLTDDAFSVTATPLQITRSGGTATQIDLNATSVNVNGVPAATVTTGSFTMTLSTGCSTTPTGTAKYTKIGNVVTLLIPTFSCTSNVTSDTVLSGLPAAIQPVTAFQRFGAVEGQNSGTVVAMYCGISGSVSSISCQNGLLSANWTASGTRVTGTGNGAVVTYTLN